MFAVGSTEELEECAARLGALVAAVDLADLVPAAVKRLVELGDQIERRGHALKTLAAARVAASPVWRGDGARTAEEWLARSTGTSVGDAKRTIATGQHLERLPTTAAAVRDGTLSPAQASEVATAATADPAAERRLLDRAATGSLGELRDECRRTTAAADPDPEATHRRTHAARRVRSWVDAAGVGHAHLSGTPASIARIMSAVNHRADQLFRERRAANDREPVDAYRFDAIEQLATAGGHGTPIPAGADAKIIVRVDHAALTRGRAVAGETCEIAGIGPVPVSVVESWMDDAFVAAILTEGEDVRSVVHLGRRFTSKQRTALQWKDPQCARRGCTNTLGLQYDHVEDWAATRTTRIEAGQRYCPSCHRLKTTGWTMGPTGPDRKHDLHPPTNPPHDPTTALAASVARIEDRRASGAPPAGALPLDLGRSP